MDCLTFIGMVFLLAVHITVDGMTANYPLHKSKCAVPMTLVKRIAFQVKIDGPIDSDKHFNVTLYEFDKIVCNFMGFNFKGDTEVYQCDVGNIVSRHECNNLWVVFKSVLIILCTTSHKPKILPNSTIFFNCEDTETVQPSLLHVADSCDCDMVNNIVLAPISVHALCRFHNTSFEEWHKLVNYSSFNGFTLDDVNIIQCPSSFFCFLPECSSLLVTAHDKQNTTAVEDLLESFLVSFLQAPIIPTSLEITHTKVSSLSDVICEYKDLQRLAVVHNKVQVLPRCLHTMVKLKILDTSFNAIESVGEIIFGSERHAAYLDLSFNRITFVKQNAFMKLKNLTFLSLRNNLLTELNFQLPDHLIRLDVSQNKIKHLPNSFPYLKVQSVVSFKIHKGLETLDLSNNYIKVVPKHFFENATNLKYLFLNNNRIKVFQLSWNNLPGSGLRNMREVNLKSNLIEKLHESLFEKNLEFIDLSYNLLKSIDLEILLNAEHLRKLLLQHNNVSEIIDNVLNGSKAITIFSNLHVINLSYNLLTKAPLGLIFWNVSVIDLSHNKIEKCTWSNMSKANILKNIDKRLTSRFSDTEKRTVRNKILVSYNQIKSFQDVFGSISIMLYKDAALKCHMSLHYNPFHCDCRMYSYLKALDDWKTQITEHAIIESENLIVSKKTASEATLWGNEAYEELTCDSPSSLKSHRILDNQILDKLTCNLLPNEKCKYIFKPSDLFLVVECSNLKLKNIPVVNESLVHALVESAAKNQVIAGINLNFSLNGNNFGSINTTGRHLLPLFLEDYISSAHIKSLDLSHSNITDIDDLFLMYLSTKLPHLSCLILNNNNLTNWPLEGHIQSFEDETRNIKGYIPFWDKVTEIHLYNNPWDCSCNKLWMKKWLNKLIVRNILVKPDKIICGTPERNKGQMFYMVEDSDFCPFTDKKIIIILVISIVLAVLILRHVFHKLWPDAPLPPNRDDILDDSNTSGMTFDAFVSYCEPDSEWVEQELIPNLQQHNPPYKVCHHKQYFQPGMPSEWNEFMAIIHSRRIIIVMSNSYLEREHCRFEFTTAYSYWIHTKNSPRIVIVKYPDLEIVNRSEACSAYFKRFTYLAKDEHTFKRLFQFMPLESLEQEETGDMNAGPLPVEHEDTALQLRADIGPADAIQDVHQEELRQEGEKYKRMWEEAELEAAERADEGEDVGILTGEIFLQKIDNALKHPKSE